MTESNAFRIDSQSASEITSGGRSFTVWLPLVLQLSRLGEVIN